MMPHLMDSLESSKLKEVGSIPTWGAKMKCIVYELEHLIDLGYTDTKVINERMEDLFYTESDLDRECQRAFENGYSQALVDSEGDSYEDGYEDGYQYALEQGC